MIPFAEWLPDQQDLNNPGVPTIKNVIPHTSGYLPVRALDEFTDALTARPRGTFYARDKDNNVYTYAGTETAIYSLSGNSWTDVSRTTSAYTSDATDSWQFVKWNEEVIATNFRDEMQLITLGGTAFADLGGGPPKARHIAAVRNFVVAGNTNDAVDGNVPNRVRWSAADDHESWTVSASTQADYEDLYGSGGWVQRVFGGEYGVIFQEASIWRMTYQGTPVIFAFDEVLPGHGLIAPGAAAQHGDLIFFLSQDGFEVLTNGSAAQPIGAQKVDRFVLSDIDESYLDRVRSAIDIANHHFYMVYPGVANNAGMPNKLVVYDWSINKWGYAEINMYDILNVASPGVTLEGLDAFSTNLDLLTPSMDDNVWKGGAPRLATFSEDMKLSFFTGAPLAAVIETAEVQIHRGRRTLLNEVRPLVDGGSSSIQIGSRQAQADARAWSATASVNTRGRATIRNNARYHSIRANLSGEWTHAQGVEVSGSMAGWR